MNQTTSAALHKTIGQGGMTQPSSKFLRHGANDSLYNTVSSPGMEGQSSNKKLNKANAFR